jgi:hypothetical protein
MLLKNLFILPSNSSPLTQSLTVLFWVVLWLLVFEMVLSLVPYNPPYKYPNAAQRYLEYGRSVEGKIRRMIGQTDETTVPVALAGWLDPQRERWEKVPTKPTSDKGLLIAIYGMSFAQHVGWALDKITEPPVTVRFLGGPGAPPNHAYATYQLDKGRHQARVIILGITAGGLVGMTTFTSMNKAFEYPLPYTYPKYRQVGDQLETFWPSVRTIDDLRQALQDQALWEKYVQEMVAEDSYYHPLLFHENVFDHLAIFRFLRRAWAKRFAHNLKNRHYEVAQGFGDRNFISQGFEQESQLINTLKLMVKEFARQVREEGKLPILMLFNNRGYNDHLYQALASTIAEANIPTMNSHAIAPSDDPKNIAPDNYHYSKAVNQRFAQAIMEMIQSAGIN